MLLTTTDAVHAEVARFLRARLGRLDGEIDGLTRRVANGLIAHPLFGLPGAGPITVARLIAEFGELRRP